MTMIKSDLFFFSSTEHIVRSNEKQAKQVQATKQSHNQYSSIHWHKWNSLFRENKKITVAAVDEMAEEGEKT